MRRMYHRMCRDSVEGLEEVRINNIGISRRNRAGDFRWERKRGTEKYTLGTKFCEGPPINKNHMTV